MSHFTMTSTTNFSPFFNGTSSSFFNVTLPSRTGPCEVGAVVPHLSPDLSIFRHFKAPSQPPDTPLWEMVVKIAFYFLAFVLTMLGNSMVIVIICLNKRMRSTINVLLVNQAVADLMVAAVCMWVHLGNSLTPEWPFGPFVCKVNTFCQVTAVTASVLTLTVISMERFTAIVFPLTGRWTPVTNGVIIAVTWLVAVSVASPHLVLRQQLEVRWQDRHEVWCAEEWPQVYKDAQCHTWKPGKNRFAFFSEPVSKLELFRNVESSDVHALHPANEASVRIVYKMLRDSEDDVFVEHKVNGVPREELPEEDKCCSELHWPFLDFSHQQSNRFCRTVDPEGNTVFVCQDHKFCVEQYHYGLHTFTVRRQFYNPDTGREDYVEVVYGSVLVVPELSELFSDVKNNAYFDYLHLTDCWENNKTVLSEYCTNKLKHKKAMSRLHFLVDCWATMVIYILLHVYYVWWTWSLLSYLVSLTLPDVFSKSVVVMVQHDSPAEFHASIQKRHHVFLAYAEADVEVLGHIKSILRSYDLTVYDCQNDVALGQAPLTAWDQAMENCSSFIIVISSEYLLEPELILQFQSIHNMMLEHRVKENRVVLVVAGRCHIPPALGPLPIIDLQQKHWERHLEWWAFCLKGEFPNETVVNQVGRDFRRDAYRFLVQNRRDDDDVKQVLPQFSFIFKKLEAISMSGELHAVHHDDKEDDIQEKNRGGIRSGMTTSKSHIHSPCKIKGLESHSDLGEGDAVNTSMKSTHCNLTKVSVSTESQQEESVELPHLGDEVYASSGPRPTGADIVHDVFLTYCEESSWDCAVAAEIKAALEGSSSKYNLFPDGQGLRVHDAVHDLLPGQAEVHVVSAAAKSSAFVVLLSPAYVQDPITRRLHFPQVLQAVFSDAVKTECVLIVHTSGTLTHPHLRAPHCQVHDGDDDEEREASDRDAESPVYKAWEEEEDFREGLNLPKWFQAFTHLHWSPCVGLCEEERLKRWARHVCHLVTATKPSDSDG